MQNDEIRMTNDELRKDIQFPMTEKNDEFTEN